VLFVQFLMLVRPARRERCAFAARHRLLENTRRATYAQRAYTAYNPENWAGYGPDVWA
jgi:hypothetical protein